MLTHGQVKGRTNINSWCPDIGVRLQSFGDDGHAIKQARATAICHELMKKYETKPWAVLKGDEIWKKIQHMVVDAVEGPGVLYVRCAGLQEVWQVLRSQGVCATGDKT